MRWSILNKLSVRPSLKCNGAGAAMGAEALSKGIDETNALINMGVSSYLNHKNAKSLIKMQQQWQEDMYNKYMSPKAMYQQYKDANLNPYLMMNDNGPGSLPSSSASTGPGTSPLNPNSAPLGTVSALDAERDYYTAASSNQRSQAVMNMIQAVNNAIIEHGPIVGKRMLDQVLPQFAALNYDESNVLKLFAPQLMEAQANANIKNIESQWQEKHGFEYRSSQLMKVNQEIDTLVGKQGLMSSQADLNRQKIVESSSVIARNLAEALKLNKEGDYYVANIQTANQIRGYLINNMILQNGNLAQAFRDLEIMIGNHEAEAKIKRYIASNPYLQGLNYVMDNVGKVVHVGANFNWSDAKGMINSVSTVTHGNVPNMPTVTGFAP